MCPVCEYGLFYFYLFLFFILEVGHWVYCSYGCVNDFNAVIFTSSVFYQWSAWINLYIILKGFIQVK